jgi:hypothetical protein
LSKKGNGFIFHCAGSPPYQNRSPAVSVHQIYPGYTPHGKILRQALGQIFIAVTLATDTAGPMTDIDSGLIKLGEIF